MNGKMPAFGSPASGYEESPISEQITEMLIGGGASYAIKAPNSLSSSSIEVGDAIIVNREMKPKNGSIVVVRVRGDVVLVRLVISKTNQKIYLACDDHAGTVDPDELEIIGVVTNIIKDHL